MQTFFLGIAKAKTLKEIDDIKSVLFGKNGQLSNALRDLSKMDPEKRKEHAAQLNQLKSQLLEAIKQQRRLLEEAAWKETLKSESLDITLPCPISTTGYFHPLMHTMSSVLSIFSQMGFSIRRGPDIESDLYNFTALNFPAFHPARTMQDTFYLGPQTLLRTHTSPMQIRTMQKEGGCMRLLVPGRVYRADYDQTHTPMFHQVEGLVVGEDVHMGHLKGCLDAFLQLFFDKPIRSRFRPSFFPFTQPSVEVDIACQKGPDRIEVGAGNDWLEILGCGMVHPQVIKNCHLNATKVRGFAFGMGIERLSMLKYGITDLRLLYENDQRWLSHYGFSSSTPGL